MKKQMRKFLQRLLVCALVLACAYGAPARAAAAETEYVTQTETSYDYDSSTGTYRLVKTATYNKKGLLTERRQYESKETYVEKLAYNKAGKKTSYKEYNNGKLLYSKKYTYDKKKRIKTETSKLYDGNGKCTYKNTVTYKYSKNGKSGTATDTYGAKYKITYCSNENEKTEKWYDKDGVLIYEIRYDKYGNEIFYKYVNISSVQEVQEIVTTYSNSKKGIRKKCTSSMYYYDESGKKVKSDGGNYAYTYYTSGYRAGWLKKEVDKTSGTTSTTTYKYKKDKTGKNVGTQKEYKDGVLTGKTVYTWKKVSK